MDRALSSLSSDFRPLAVELLARLTERGVAVLICQTSRTPAEAATNLANGTSATSHSKHLPRCVRGFALGFANDSKADAIDLAPFGVYQLHGPNKVQWDDDDRGHPAFAIIGDIAESLGARWGGRWTKPHDPGHVEFLFPGERYADIPSTSAAYAAHGIPA